MHHTTWTWAASISSTLTNHTDWRLSILFLFSTTFFSGLHLPNNLFVFTPGPWARITFFVQTADLVPVRVIGEPNGSHTEGRHDGPDQNTGNFGTALFAIHGVRGIKNERCCGWSTVVCMVVTCSPYHHTMPILISSKMISVALLTRRTAANQRNILRFSHRKKTNLAVCVASASLDKRKLGWYGTIPYYTEWMRVPCY